MKRVIILLVTLLVGLAVWCYQRGTSFCNALRSIAQQKVVIDCSSTSVLDAFESDRAREALLRHLSASAAWRVTARSEIHEQGKDAKMIISADRRGEPINGSGDWPAFTQCTVTVRFDASVPGNIEKGTCAIAEAGSVAVQVPLSPAPDGSHTLGSMLIVRGGSLVVQICEYSAERHRGLTKAAISEISAEFSAIRDSVEEIEREGYVRKCLPDGSLRRSAAELPLQIREGIARGMYRVTGFLNPQEKGYVTLRTFHVGSGEELDADVNSWRTLRYVGWSSRSDEKFFFECELAAPSYLTQEELKMDPSDPRRLEAMSAEQEIRIEVWFHGKRNRKLAEATKTLVPWMR